MADWLTNLVGGSWAMYINWFLIYISWWFIPLIVLWIWRIRLSKYPIDVVIYEKRGENLVKTNDMAGRFENPISCYRLLKSKDSLPIPQYDWVLQCMDKPMTLPERLVYIMRGKIGSLTLFKYSSKQYKPVKVRLDNNQVVEKLKLITDKSGQPLYISSYEYINPKQSMSKLNFEVIDWDDINHMTQELRAIALRRSPVKDFIEKYGPLMAVVLSILALIIAGYYYKDIVTSAQPQGYNPPTTTTTTQPATSPNIPVISDLIPGK